MLYHWPVPQNCCAIDAAVSKLSVAQSSNDMARPAACHQRNGFAQLVGESAAFDWGQTGGMVDDLGGQLLGESPCCGCERDQPTSGVLAHCSGQREEHV